VARDSGSSVLVWLRGRCGAGPAARRYRSLRRKQGGVARASLRRRLSARKRAVGNRPVDRTLASAMSSRIDHETAS
jgi:hypothetical protein